MAMGVPFDERRKAEVLSMLRNERMRLCCHCGCHQFSAHLGARMAKNSGRKRLKISKMTNFAVSQPLQC
jgi:translation initiation factor IF-1